MMTCDTERSSRLSPSETLVGPCSCMVYLAPSQETALKSIRIFSNIMGQPCQLSQLLCAKSSSKTSATLSGPLQMLEHRLLTMIFSDVR